jgi:mRNA-degrading endonuclease YafQ of YafQ-DinJ toxin-antitoxin module
LKLTVRRATHLKRDLKRLMKGGKDIEKLLRAVEILAEV